LVAGRGFSPQAAIAAVKQTGRNPYEAIAAALFTGRNPWRVAAELDRLLSNDTRSHLFNTFATFIHDAPSFDAASFY